MAGGGVASGLVLRPRGEVVRRAIAGETILVPIRGSVADMQRIFSLNPTAAFVWERLDGTRSAGQILLELLEAFDAPPDQARADLDAFLAAALAQGLVEEAG
jgi:hypothetical protein